MPDFIQTSTQGLGSRVFGSIKGILTGLILVVAAFPILWVNEGCAVRTARGLTEGRGSVVKVSAAAPVAANEGKLVHMTGRATSTNGARDAAFNVAPAGALRLERTVEMYQWVEKTSTTTDKNVGGSETKKTEYTYVKEWSSSAIDSRNFKIKTKDGESTSNPSMPHRSESFTANDVRLGGFVMNPGLVSQIDGGVVVPPDASRVPADLRGRARVSGTQLYVGSDPARPRVGDLRITFKQTPSTDVSVVARQWGANLAPWTTSQKTEINLLENGAQTPDQMFASAEAANEMRTWIIRFLGFLAMFIGFSLIFRPLSVVADVIPIVGSLVGIGTGFVAFALAAPLSFFTIAAAWVAYRPVLGVLLIVVGVVVLVGFFVIAKKRKR